MAMILVDYENVFASDGLKGVDVLRTDDTLIIFYSNCCGKIRNDYMQFIKDSGCDFRIMKLKNTGKNALDFYIAAECGVQSSNGETQIAIISNDKGFQAVLDYFNVNASISDVQVVKAGNIENALAKLNSQSDADRRKELNERALMLDLAAEYARVEQRNAIRKSLKEALSGTEYEQRTAEIIDFITDKKDVGKRTLYTGSLHCFGKTDGTAIYRIVRGIV